MFGFIKHYRNQKQKKKKKKLDRKIKNGKEKHCGTTQCARIEMNYVDLEIMQLSHFIYS